MFRKHFLFALLVLITGLGAIAQEETEERSKEEITEPSIKRAEENMSALRGQELDGFLERLKYIPLSKSGPAFLSIGGESRSLYEYFRNRDFTPETLDNNGWLFQRFMLHTDFRLNNFRIFLQLNSANHWFTDEPSSPVERDDLDLHQAFVEFGSNSFKLRLGRQEIGLGARRLFAFREGPNARLAYNGVRAFWKTRTIDFTAFYAEPLRNIPGTFDNRTFDQESTWAIHGTINPETIPGNFDFYYIGFNSTRRVYNKEVGEETRHSLGFRHFGNTGSFSFNNEFVYQFGDYAGGNISAYTFSFDLNYQLSSSGWRPEVGLKTELISGDKDSTDNRLNTFNALFPRGAYFGLIALIGPANLVDIHPEFSVSPTETLSLTFDWDIFWRYQIEDGVYGPNASLFREAGNYDGNFLGHQPGIEAAFKLSRYWEMSLEASYFIASDYWEATGEGENVFHTAITTAFKF